MVRRPFQRVFGQTSLEAKCLALFGAFLLVVITVSFLLYWKVTENVVSQQNPSTGKLLADQIILARHFDALETVYALDRKNTDFLSVLHEFLNSLNQRKYEWRFITPNSQDPEKQPRDAFARRVLEDFLQVSPKEPGTTQDYRQQLTDGGGKYHYYQPIRYQRSCNPLCHRVTPGGSGIDLMGTGPSLARSGPVPQLPIQEGDLMAVLEVTIPNKETQDEINWYWNMLLVVAIITAFLAIVAFYVTIRYVIVRPLTHLRNVSDAISHGNVALRAEIRTGDEFEALGSAFNRMLRHLVTIQDELRQVNADRTPRWTSWPAPTCSSTR